MLNSLCILNTFDTLRKHITLRIVFRNKVTCFTNFEYFNLSEIINYSTFIIFVNCVQKKNNLRHSYFSDFFFFSGVKINSTRSRVFCRTACNQTRINFNFANLKKYFAFEKNVSVCYFDKIFVSSTLIYLNTFTHYSRRITLRTHASHCD